MLEVNDVLEILGIQLIGIVPEDESILVSTNVGNIASLSSNSKASEAFNNIAKRIQGQDIPYQSLDSDTGFLAGLRRIFGGAS